MPDRTYIFVIDPKNSLARIKNRNKLIPFEKTNFLEKVSNNYFKIAICDRYKKIDATKPIKEITDLCLNDIKSNLSDK
jgi:thymidylate kinase